MLRDGNTFNILVVDDDPTGESLLRELTKNLQHRHELHFVWDGVLALDFLHRRGAYENAPRPHLILLDVNLPRLGGVETLSAIKSDPDLCVIPVMMLSTSSSAEDVRKSYQARANCYVEKPTDLARSIRLVQAIEAFWMEFVLAPGEERELGSRALRESKTVQPRRAIAPGDLRSGPSIASTPAETKSRAVSPDESPGESATGPRRAGCGEHNRLLDQFAAAVREVIDLHEQQFLAILEGDSECHRFDLLIHMANEKKQSAKYAYLRHVEAHGCSNTDAVKHART